MVRQHQHEHLKCASAEIRARPCVHGLDDVDSAVVTPEGDLASDVWVPSNTHTATHTHIHTHTQPRPRTRIHIVGQSVAYKYTYINVLRYIYTTYTHTQSHTRSHSHTHIHEHTPRNDNCLDWVVSLEGEHRDDLVDGLCHVPAQQLHPPLRLDQ